MRYLTSLCLKGSDGGRVREEESFGGDEGVELEEEGGRLAIEQHVQRLEK